MDVESKISRRDTDMAGLTWHDMAAEARKAGCEEVMDAHGCGGLCLQVSRPRNSKGVILERFPNVSMCVCALGKTIMVRLSYPGRGALWVENKHSRRVKRLTLWHRRCESLCVSGATASAFLTRVEIWLFRRFFERLGPRRECRSRHRVSQS